MPRRVILRPAEGEGMEWTPITGSGRVQSEAAVILLAAIVESSGDAIVAKSLDGTILSWNRSAEDLYGYAADEIVGRNIAALVAPDRRDEMLRILQRIGAGEQVEHYETVRRHKDGGAVDV